MISAQNKAMPCLKLKNINGAIYVKSHITGTDKNPYPMIITESEGNRKIKRGEEVFIKKTLNCRIKIYFPLLFEYRKVLTNLSIVHN